MPHCSAIHMQLTTICEHTPLVMPLSRFSREFCTECFKDLCANLTQWYLIHIFNFKSLIKAVFVIAAKEKPRIYEKERGL